MERAVAQRCSHGVIGNGANARQVKRLVVGRGSARKPAHSVECYMASEEVGRQEKYGGGYNAGWKKSRQKIRMV